MNLNHYLGDIHRGIIKEAFVMTGLRTVGKGIAKMTKAMFRHPGKSLIGAGVGYEGHAAASEAAKSQTRRAAKNRIYSVGAR